MDKVDDLDQIVTASAKKAGFQLEVDHKKIESMRWLKSGQFGQTWLNVSERNLVTGTGQVPPELPHVPPRRAGPLDRPPTTGRAAHEA